MSKHTSNRLKTFLTDPVVLLVLALALGALLFAANAKANANACERPRHDPKLDVGWMAVYGNFAPYSCRAVARPQDVDIEHIVAFAEARRSGLACGRAREFVNDAMNIAVAYPYLNQRVKIDKDAARWVPEHNQCWFADRVQRVKAKYGLSMDAAERRALTGILENCTAAERREPRCDL